MDEIRSIERFLESNSSVNPRPAAGTVVQADLKTKYRPDKLFVRDGLMKWNMIFNGIDTPHRMANRSMQVRIDPTWLKTELAEIKDFKI